MIKMKTDNTIFCVCDQQKLTHFDECSPYDTIVGWSEEYDIAIIFLNDLLSKHKDYGIKMTTYKKLKKNTTLPYEELELVFNGKSYIPKRYLRDWFDYPDNMKESYDESLSLLNFLVTEREMGKKDQKTLLKAIDLLKELREEYIESQVGFDLDCMEQNHQLTEEWKSIIYNTNV